MEHELNQILDSLYFRLIEGEWREVNDETLENAEKLALKRRFNQGYLDRIAEIKNQKSHMMCEI
jgi:hypothetical protein